MQFLLAERAQRGDEVTWQVLTRGFEFEGKTVQLIGQRGIWKPATLQFPISVTTTPPKPGRPPPYDDDLGEDGHIRYRYQGTDPNSHDNAGLRDVFRLGLPLIYFYGLEKGLYLPVFPVVVMGDEPANLTFVLQATAAASALVGAEQVAEVSEAARHYQTVAAKVRIHQRAFRIHVLRAYREHCTVCRLKHPELLDAAHIIPDRDPRGRAAVTNGLSLCKLHHAAFDTNYIGISPDYIVEVREDILDEEDGPMLRHGLQGMHRQKILLPRKAEHHPEREALAERYEGFRRAQ